MPLCHTSLIILRSGDIGPGFGWDFLNTIWQTRLPGCAIVLILLNGWVSIIAGGEQGDSRLPAVLATVFVQPLLLGAA